MAQAFPEVDILAVSRLLLNCVLGVQ
jgi:hypothetical protein